MCYKLEIMYTLKFRLSYALKYTGIRKMHLLNEKAFINGNWVSAISQKTFDILNPADGTVIASVPDMNKEDAQQAIEAAKESFNSWRFSTSKDRSRALRKWFDLLEDNKESISKIMTAESGKPLIESSAETTYGNSFIEWYSELPRHVRGELIPSPIPTKKILVEKHPIGVVGLITPWNFPHAMITRKVGAVLAAGCTCVVRPAEDTPLTALALAQLALEAGIPKGVVNIVTSSRDNAADVGKLFCESPLVSGISFTGSTAVGKLLYKLCSSGIKRIGLELGGNAPFIVFNSADLTKAVEGAMVSKFRNCGQSCVATNRFFVQSDIYEAFVAKFAEKIKEIKLGPGLQPGVTAGPLINKAQLGKVAAFVDDALSKGAKAVVGGKRASDKGDLFYEPTLLTNVTNNMQIYNEEVFGPVASVIPFKTEEEVLNIANTTKNGLAGYFFSEDVAQIFRVTKLLEMGMLGINEGLISTPEAPFGGIKESGIGREGSHYGIDEFTYLKYICIGTLV